jgi:signal transduction histidine kinase
LNEQVIEVRQMIESLLFLARADDDSEPPNLTLVDLSAWILNYLLKWNNHCRVNDLHPMFGQGIVAAISPPLLTQLLDNLVNNALKYSENGSPVSIHLKQQASEIALTVADHGIGITSQDRQAIFEPFFRSQNARRSGIAGTGLGLALARRIATTLNGRLECTSVLNEGSQFTLYLPVPHPGLPGQVDNLASMEATSTAHR